MATEEPLPATPGRTTAIRISRGARAMGTDEALGVVYQIIMNQRTGELQALVITTASAQHLELPATHLLRATEDTIYLDLAAADLCLRPDLAAPYNPDQYVPVRAYPVFSPREASQGASSSACPLVTNIEHDAVGVVAPESERGPLPPSSLIPTAPLIEPSSGEHHSAAVADTATPESVANADEPSASGLARDELDEATAEATPGDAESASHAWLPPIAVPIFTVAGVESATVVPASEDTMNEPTEEEEGSAFMEGSMPPVNPVNPGMMSNVIHSDDDTITEVFDESQQAYTRSTPPDAPARVWAPQGLASSSAESNGSRLSWAPAVALGVVFVGVATWSTVRAIRRGRRKAALAAMNARISAETWRAAVRDSVRGAGKSAVDLAQTVRASAQEIAANPRDTATDAFSNLAEFPARYRWFRRGVRVGARTERLRRRQRVGG